MSRIASLRAYALRMPVDFGPSSSLADMPVRNGLILEIQDDEGAFGWGEIWCNFPPNGNLSRLNLLVDVMWPNLRGQTTTEPEALCARIYRQAERMRIHTGEDGPYRHCLAGIETALSDLVARRAGVPLCRYLAMAPTSSVPVYASSPSGPSLQTEVSALRDAGHTAVKLKIGYGLDRDRETVNAFAAVGEGLSLAIDANQSWDVATALNMAAAFEGYNPLFLEEPLLATADLGDWQHLTSSAPIPIAAGENITSKDGFERRLSSGCINIAQPDVAKWGGISGAWTVAQAADAAGARTYLHFMGTGLGLSASLHVAAAIGGDVFVELDANPNPLRTDLGELGLGIKKGRVDVPPGPGIGWAPDPDALSAFTIQHVECR